MVAIGRIGKLSVHKLGPVVDGVFYAAAQFDPHARDAGIVHQFLHDAVAAREP